MPSSNGVVRLEPDETELVGHWTSDNGKVVADATELRIQAIVRGLRPVAVANGGWDRLLQDPSGGRFWELSHPMGETHGGGPRALRVISASTASVKYGIKV